MVEATTAWLVNFIILSLIAGVFIWIAVRVCGGVIIRGGDYPRGKRSLDVTIVLSELRNVVRITDFFTKVILYISTKKRLRGIEAEQKRLEDAFKDIPSLL